MGVGNVMEWYGKFKLKKAIFNAVKAVNVHVSLLPYVADFAIFGALADVIGAELFPSDTASKELLKGLGK